MFAAHLVVVPRYNRSTYGRRDFSVAGSTTWNSLTDSLRDPSLSIDSFGRQLKHFVFKLDLIQYGEKIREF